MRRQRPQVTFAGWQLGGYGGMETRILAAADLASASGYDVAVRTGLATPAGSRTGAALDRFDTSSLSEVWESTLRSRAYGLVEPVLDRLRPPSKPRLLRLGTHRRVRIATDRYWDGPGREVLERTDVLHLFGPPLPFVQRAIEAAHAARVPVLYQSVHQVTAEYAANRYKAGFADCCGKLDLIVVSHRGQVAEFAEHFGYTGPVASISQWAYEVEDELLALPTPRAGGAPVVVGTLCRLDDVKGLDVLVAAFARALDRHRDLVLRIGGTGAQEAPLRAQCAALGIADRVELVGLVEDKVAFYAGLDIFALSSRSEGGPVSGVEAMAAGLPIVSTVVGAMPERLADGVGVLVEVDDVDEFARALGDLAGDRDRRTALGAAGRGRYVDRFAEQAQQVKLLDVWSELAGGRRTSG